MEIIYAGCNPNEILTMHFMIEHSKAGRVVGTKGSNILSLRGKSGVMQLKMSKDPENIGDIALRDLTVEGTLLSVRRLHYHVLEMFNDPSRAGFQYEPVPAVLNSAPPGFVPNSNVALVPMSSLTNFGLPQDFVSRLKETQTYMHQLGLDLQVVDMRPQLQVAPFATAPVQYTFGGVPSMQGTARPQQRQKQEDKEIRDGEMGFYIPKEKVGGLIGRGGQGLRDLAVQTGCKIRVDRAEVNGQRRVILSNDSEAVMLKAKDIVMHVVSGITE